MIFTCMSVRAVHLEVVGSLDTSGFINAFRRFIAVHGPVRNICSDHGTNLVGPCEDLKIPSKLDRKSVKTYLSDLGCTWIFNPPCFPFWRIMEKNDRACKILDSMFFQLKDKLTQKVLVTFMAEVAAVISARPLVSLTTDPDESFILTKAALLTQKGNSVTAPAGEFGASDL